jgi:predicted phage tail protein
MSEKDWIRGAGGKGGGGAVDDDDSLFSMSKAKIVDLISEGEIKGLLTNDAESIFINETPLVDSSGGYNFERVSWASRHGVQTQPHIPGFAGAEQEVPVGVKINKENPGAVIRTVTTSNTDALRVLVYTPSLFDADNDKGEMKVTSVQFQVSIKYDQGNWELKKDFTFDGKTSSRYEKNFRIDLSGTFNSVSIKVERLTNDPANSKVQNSIYFGSYTKIIDNKLTYPNSALMGIELDARQFASIPTRGYEIKGVKVKVPTNYTPYDAGHCDIAGIRRKDRCLTAGGNWIGTSVGDTLYNGSWDGEFTVKWTCNPAWIMYDLCTNTRYGLGNWLDENQLDKWSLYEIAKYCDAVDSYGKFEGLDDGWNFQEARFACNIYLQGAEEAYKVLNDIASIFRGMLYWQQGQISPVQDAPKDPTMNFSQANVIDGKFTYEGTSVKQRHNVAHVTWNNPLDYYRQNVEYVEDSIGITESNNQIKSIDLRAVGCTSQSQARRMGKWVLYTEKFETEAVSFSTGLEGSGVRPGDIIKISDAHKSGIRYGGRVAKGSTTTTINLDSPTKVLNGKEYKISVINTTEECLKNGIIQPLTPKCIDTDGTDLTTTYGTQALCEAPGTDKIWQTDKQALCINASNENQWKPYVWVETKSVESINSDAEVTSVTLNGSEQFSMIPTAQYMWILEEMGTIEAQDFRVLTVRETSQNIVEISGLMYHPSKYNYIDKGDDLSIKSTSNLPDPSAPVPAPTDLTITEELYEDSRGMFLNRATFSWRPPITPGTNSTYPYIASYYVEWKIRTLSDWIPLGETTNNNITINDAPHGAVIEFRVKTRRIY